jgi:hypothetical protein
MSGHTRHTRWWMEHPEKALPSEAMVQHVQGYILAMEDILRGIEDVQYGAEEAETEYSHGYGDALDTLRYQAETSRDSARRTLDTITKKEST